MFVSYSVYSMTPSERYVSSSRDSLLLPNGAAPGRGPPVMIIVAREIRGRL